MRARRSGRWAQQRAVLDHHRVPAGGLEHRGQPAGGDVGDDAVERLAVEVDDPHHLAQARHHRVGDRLPAGALVELGVADQRDLAAAAGDVEVPGDVAVRERAPDRRGGAEADAAGGVVDRVGVLRAARIGLQAAELAQRRQVLRRSRRPSRWLMACRTGLACGFTLTRSGASSTREVQRGHQAHHRGAARPDGRRPSRPERFCRTRLAWWTMLVASQSTRCSTRSSVSRSTSVATCHRLEVIR